MHNDIIKAKKLLKSGDYTCVACKADVIYKSSLRGVKPLLSFLDNEINISGFYAADKVVGGGAAHIYVKLRVKAVYSEILSKVAKNILDTAGIEVYADEIVDKIINRSGNGQCPIESAIIGIEDTDEAIAAIRRRLETL